MFLLRWPAGPSVSRQSSTSVFFLPVRIPPLIFLFLFLQRSKALGNQKPRTLRAVEDAIWKVLFDFADPNNESVKLGSLPDAVLEAIPWELVDKLSEEDKTWFTPPSSASNSLTPVSASSAQPPSAGTLEVPPLLRYFSQTHPDAFLQWMQETLVPTTVPNVQQLPSRPTGPLLIESSTSTSEPLNQDSSPPPTHLPSPPIRPISPLILPANQGANMPPPQSSSLSSLPPLSEHSPFLDMVAIPSPPRMSDLDDLPWSSPPRVAQQSAAEQMHPQTGPSTPQGMRVLKSPQHSSNSNSTKV